MWCHARWNHPPAGQGVRVLCLDRARRHFSYRHGMAPGPRKGADMLFPQHEAAVA
ncbi:hypothetical protein MJI20_31995, partial [Salmonella enterica subsp. enterica serovar Anatum]|nr:hypothetical protein [Salmonella enterica subsp. enterica serovar Anatum]